MDEQELEYLLRGLFKGHEQDINAFIKQFHDDYQVPDNELDDILSRSDKLTPNDVMTLLRFAGRDYEYLHDPEPDDNKYMGYVQDALKCRQIQKMMKELQHG